MSTNHGIALFAGVDGAANSNFGGRRRLIGTSEISVTGGFSEGLFAGRKRSLPFSAAKPLRRH
jgi:hypothetical protein